MTNTRLYFSRAMCLAALCIAPSGAGAQDRDVVFQHGIWSSAQTWLQESSNLAEIFQILPRVPITDSRAVYSVQASDMASQVGAAATNAILIGHSNGGLIGRLANMPAPYNDRPWGGLVTVGSPHGGAQLMASTVTGLTGNWLAAIVDDFLDASSYYASIAGLLPLEVATAVNADQDFFGVTADVTAALGTLWFSVLNPVSGDMVPGSNVLENVLNTPGNLNRESAALPVRVGIRSTLQSNTGLVWKGLRGDGWQAYRNSQMVAAAIAEIAWATTVNYENEEDPGFAGLVRTGAHLWLDLAVDVEAMDNDYCFLMGAWVVNHCGASDGIVPQGAQTYLGATRVVDITGPSHIEETRSPEADAALKQIFDNDLQIPRRPIPPPPPWAAIQGPAIVPPGSCYWYASTNVASPNYRWTVDGNVVGTNFDLHYTAGSDFTLDLYVWNGSGDEAGASLPISVSFEEDACTLAPASVPRAIRPAAGKTNSRQRTGVTRVP